MDLYKPGGSSIRDLLGMLFGKREAPSATPQVPVDNPAQLSVGAITPVAPIAPIAPPWMARRRARAPGYDNAAMDYLTAPLQEGPNTNIDDETRARALAWALRSN